MTDREITYRENITAEQAAEELIRFAAPVREPEEVPLLEASGRILAEDMTASFDNPPFDRSPIDGYACRSEDIASASPEHPVYLTVTEEIDAGGWPSRGVGKNEAARIMTGAPVPDGCDCCVYQEKTDCGEETAAFFAPCGKWENYCFRGEDFKKGDLLLKAGTKLGFVELGVLAGMGCDRVNVYRKPRIVLLTSGDEVTEPGKPLLPGKIYNSNLTMIAARLLEFGLPAVYTAAVADDPGAMAEMLRTAAEKADLIVTTGAVSVGKKDIMHEAVRLIGADRVFWRVQMKPGMPTLFSVYKGVSVLSLSGNPFGAAAAAEVLLRPALQHMTGDPSLALVRRKGVMAEDFSKRINGRRFVRAIYEDGRVYLPDGLHSNGVLSSMAGCNCLIDAKPDRERLLMGDPVEILLL